MGQPLSNTDPSQAPGWQASLGLRFARRDRKTVLVERSHSGPLAVQRPFYPEGGVCHVYVLHPPGGVVGGDSLEIQVGLENASEALITTPGATKFYRSAGACAHQRQTLRVAADAALEWFPQESIVFPAALVNAHTRVDLEAGSRFAGWEIVCLGRPVIGETFDDGRVDLRLSLYRGGEPLLLERLHVGGASQLARGAELRGFPVSATMLLTPAGQRELALARGAVHSAPDQLVGITLVGDVLIVRLLGNGTEQARACLAAIWSALRPGLFDRPASLPRIWAT